MRLPRSLLLTAFILLLIILVLFGLIAPATAGIAIDPAFVAGRLRSVLMPATGDAIRLPPGSS